MVTVENSFKSFSTFLKMNHVNDCEIGNRDLVVSIKKSETIDLMDFTDSGAKGVKDTCTACNSQRRR